MTVDNWFAPVSCMPEWCNIIKVKKYVSKNNCIILFYISLIKYLAVICKKIYVIQFEYKCYQNIWRYTWNQQKDVRFFSLF